MRVAFCLYTKNPDDLTRSEFYRQDVEILESLGHEVVPVLRPYDLLRKRFDLAFVWWWSYLWAWGPLARLRRLPVVVTGTFDLEPTLRSGRIKLGLKRVGLRFADIHLFVSELEAREVPRAFQIPVERCAYSPHVVDVDFYSPSPVNVSPLARGEFVLGNVAWQKKENCERKMLPELIAATALLARRSVPVRLVLAGPPMDGAPMLKELVRRHRIEHLVEFPGELSREAKRKLMRDCDAYVQVSRFEGFGVAIAEAMACGASVICSRTGAVPEVVGDCGRYVDALTPEAIADAVERSIADRAAFRALGGRARQRVVELFSPARRANDFARAIAAATSNR